MKKYISFLSFLFLFSSCKNEKHSTTIHENQKKFTSITVDTLLHEELSIRAILIDENKIWYAANKGQFGSIDLQTDKRYTGHITKDSIALEFRSIAKTKEAIFLLNVGSPALLYRVSKDGSQIKKVYEGNHEKIFYDSMHFWNNHEGIAMGDPTEDCLSVLITRNGGTTWNKVPCENLPKIKEGEAAFAASNTNIVVNEKETWMVSGGNKSRVFYSPNKGKSWRVYETPIVQGEAMTGIFTADFYDSKNGFIAGGNYEKPTQNFGNKALTTDGGKTWKLIAENESFGYVSCVQYIPNSNAKQLVTIGASGLYYSSNSGKKWTKLWDNSTLFTIRFVNDSTAIAAGKNKILRLNFK